MARTVKIRLPNGISHVYEDVPDDITDADVQARAAQDFPDQAATAAEATQAPAGNVEIAPPEMGTGPVAPSFSDYSTLPTSAKQIAGAAMIPIQFAVEHPGEAAAVGGVGVGAKYLQGKQIEAKGAGEVAKIRAQADLENIKLQREKEAARAARAGIKPTVGPVSPGPMPTTPPGAGQQAFSQMGQSLGQQTAPQSMASKVREFAASRIINPISQAGSSIAQAAPMLGTAGRVAGKILPGAGAALGGVEAYNRAQQGDYVGAGLAGLGGAASFVPGVGTAIGMGTTAINAKRDYDKYLEAKRKYEEQQRAMKR